MSRYVCSGCYYTYDPKTGIPDHEIKPGTAFSDLPDDWVCPECGLGKEAFREYKE
jgi:rubredoxin